MEPLIRATKKLAKLRCQEQLLAKFGDCDLFSSIRPRIGKRFTQPGHNKMLNTILEEARSKIIEVGIKEKNEMIVNAQIELCRIYTNMQQLPFVEYKELKAKADRAEKSLILNFEKNIARKVKVYKSRNGSSLTEVTPSPILSLPRQRRKHRRTQREVRRAYDKRRRARNKENKKRLVTEEIEKIKQSNLVKNFSSEDIPNSAYLFLSLGSTFCMKQCPKLHDYVFDAKEFCRKLAWVAFYEAKKKSSAIQQNTTSDLKDMFESDEETDEFLGFANTETVPIEAEVDNGRVNGWMASKKLKIKSRKNPEFNDPLLNSVTQKIKDGVRQIELPKKPRSNLTLLEAEGMRWCRRAVQEDCILLKLTKAAV